MTDKQPKALKLADELEMLWTLGEPAAEELRRLYSVNERLLRERHILVESSQKDAAAITEKDALLRQALAQLEINRTNFYKAPSKSICKMLAGGNDEVITAIKERING